MYTHYADILSRIDAPVLWWDEHGVPRFDPFAPRLTANFYASEAVLVRIECQCCATPFDVAMTSGVTRNQEPKRPMLRDLIEQNELRYGDPPNSGCCDAGPSTTAIERNVLEYWVKPFALGEGMGEHPALPNVSSILDPTAMNWRQELGFETIDLSPDWAR